MNETIKIEFKSQYTLIKLLQFTLFRNALAEKNEVIKNLIFDFEKASQAKQPVAQLHQALYVACRETFPQWKEWIESFKYETILINQTFSDIDKSVLQIDAENKWFTFHNPEGYKNVMEKVGPLIWKDLHIYAKNWNGDGERQQWFLHKIKTRIPCGECKNFWINEVETNPPPTTSASDFFAWSVDVHNKVNIKLNKPITTLEEANNLY